MVGTHGVGKLSKLTKAEEAIVALDKASDVLKTESKVVYAIGEIEKSRKLTTWDRAGVVVDDHAYVDHVVLDKQWGTLFQNKDQFQAYVANVLDNPSEYVEGVRFNGEHVKMYWDDRLGNFIIEKQNSPTVFLAERGKAYFEKEVSDLRVINKRTQ